MKTVKGDREEAGWRPPVHRTWTREDGEQMLAAWQASGLSASSFVQRHGFSLHRLYYWKARLSEPGAVRRPVGALIPVRVVEESRAVGNHHPIEIRLLGGRSLLLHGSCDEAQVAKWVRVMESLPC